MVKYLPTKRIHTLELFIFQIFKHVIFTLGFVVEMLL